MLSRVSRFIKPDIGPGVEAIDPFDASLHTAVSEHVHGVLGVPHHTIVEGVVRTTQLTDRPDVGEVKVAVHNSLHGMNPDAKYFPLALRLATSRIVQVAEQKGSIDGY